MVTDFSKLKIKRFFQVLVKSFLNVPLIDFLNFASIFLFKNYASLSKRFYLDIFSCCNCDAYWTIVTSLPLSSQLIIFTCAQKWWNSLVNNSSTLLFALSSKVSGINLKLIALFVQNNHPNSVSNIDERWVRHWDPKQTENPTLVPTRGVHPVKLSI